ncbi:PE family protein [Mycobacterium sp. Marseille-P9652]|uniref:PE family protein n=1 Tax=Mycobacterium sp. Marseille-P9652 TaxID=2654950 RepID=UPI0012E8BBE3|nr:PE family protein [Mycobacterium sp. Marseille-P9652]
MSYVIATPDLVESAANNLAGIRSSLAEAAATAAGPTTGIATAAQDEISIAIASLFGNVGQEFQALSAQAQGFHQQFVELMNAGAGAYASAEAANAGQALLGGAVGGEIQVGAQAISNAIADAPITLGTLSTGGVSALAGGVSSFGSAVAAPYQALVVNTATNLQAINATFSANPFPFLHQLAANQAVYAHTIASSIATGIQNLPVELANLPATVQTGVQALSTLDPGALLQQFVSTQTGYAQTVVTSLQAAGQDLITGVQTLPTGFQTAFGDLLVGDNGGAYAAVNTALVNAFLPGFQPVTVELGGTTPVPVVPLGPLGDLAPVLTIPGQMAQNFTNLLPAGSIPAQIAQNFTNVVNTLTNFGTTVTGSLVLSFGLPLQLVFDSVGMPINTLAALNSSSVAFVSAVQAGNASAAAAALLDAPAYAANAFLNGQTYIALPELTSNITIGGFPLGQLVASAELPVGGLLTPLNPVVLNPGGPIFGTPIGGFIPGLLSFGSQLAAAITPVT